MSQSRVSVILDGIDKLTPTLKGLANSTQSLGAGAVFLGNMYTKAFEVAASGVEQLMKRFSEASDMQSSAIGMAGQFSAMTGKSYEATGVMIEELNSGFSKMAAKLPGATQDYKDLGMAISDTLIKANTVNGVFDENAFKKQAFALTETLGILRGTNKELLTSDIQLFFTKFSEGASESELRILKLNERMPGLMGELEKAQKKLGMDGKKLEQLTLQERVKIMQVATRNLAPPEMIRDLQKTASSQIEGFKTAMFDQNEGIFGFLRKVKNVNGKAQTVMDGFASLLSETLGENGLFAVAGKTLRTLGIDFGDPMVMLYDGLMIVSGWARATGNFLRGLTLPDLTKLSPERLGQMFADTIDLAFAKTGEFLSKIDYGQIVRGLGDALSASLKALGSFLMSLDWSTYLTAGLVVIGGILTIGVITAIGGALAAGVAALAGVPLLVIAGVGLLIIGVAKAVIDNWAIIATTWNNFWSAVGNTVVGFIQGAIAFWQSVIDNTKSTVSRVISWFGENVGSKVSEMITSISAWFSEQITKVKSFISNPIGTIQGAVTGNPVTNHATGLNTGSLLSAISRESQAMPTGSNIAIANTSEAILNRSQQRDLIGLVAASRPRGNAGTFAPQIVINASPGMDTNDLAEKVMKAIEGRWREYQLSTL